MCHLKVVLLCKGRGGDAASYQPARDESQWWNRRDALVRCAAAFLHGPSSAHCTSRELVLVHDEDWARVHMTVGDGEKAPSEAAVIGAWRETALAPHALPNGTSPVACRLVHSAAPLQDASAVAAMESKRDVLVHMQKHCTMEFLRAHHLNSKPDVILRKTNKAALLAAWEKWTALHASAESASTKQVVTSIFRELLQPKDASIQTVVAGTLHESSDAELPCFAPDTAIPSADPSLQVVLFLGAVRDMSSAENATLQKLCAAQSIPLTRVRLGAVAEFTSKILSVLAFHQATGVLAPALLRTIAAESRAPPAKRLKAAADAPAHLHVLCSVPLPSTAVTTELARRSRSLWAMVRVAVVTLWRSRVASSDAHPLATSLTFVLEDGKAITLRQDELVTSLAEQHMAAPSEFQILGALCKALACAVAEPLKDLALRLIASDCDDNASVYAVEVSTNAADSGVVDIIYDTPEAPTHGNLLVLLPLGPELRAHKALLAACTKSSIPVHRQCLLQAQDAEAATITMFQHFIYQRRLWPCLEALAATATTDDKQPGSPKVKKAKKAKKVKKPKNEKAP
ncbi:hypothetical protein ACHHYP_05608 [Achlya hypogyna]|uniref:Uncharacterized protein n=1 Tax=Achlya hypogyna TaxID=1202772 RepID=A0A1V9YXI9_ACHHY|nr:hypothetical protein ACHHYP_05608 [Achlya hypogyna]